MVSSLAKSIALASALCASPSSWAFTTSPSSSSSSPSQRTFRSNCRPSTSLRNDASPAGDENDPWRAHLASSQQEERLNSDGGIPDLPSSSSTHPFSELESASDAVDDANAEPRASEFGTLEPRPPSPDRLARLDAEARSRSVYVPSGSDGYWDLRDEISQLEDDLRSATEAGVSDEARGAIERMLRRARAKDPAHVYRVVGEAARSAGERGDEEAGGRYGDEVARARGMLPQFNLEGLWVGKYGSHGFEMINVTYSGDTLVAYKVTGDKNIPRGEISFTADLSPRDPSAPRPPGEPAPLEPIQLSEGSAKKWGTRRLPRFPGQGHAAEPGYRNPKFLEGQLVVIGPGDYFSFAWVPLEHQIFFGRPSPELTLKMLREGGGSSLTAGTGRGVPGRDAGRGEMAEFAGRCLEVTEDAVWDERREGKADPHSCIYHDDDHCYFE